MNTTAFFKCLPAALLVLASHAPLAHAQPGGESAMSQKLHANAVASFREGRFSEAYGRLIPLADAGHAPSAELALWMYQHGPAVFGKDWDSTPAQLAAWSQTAGQPMQAMTPVVSRHELVVLAARQR